MPSDSFREEQLKKQTQFHEWVHAAFVLNTSFSRLDKLTERQRSWLNWTYPGSRIEVGTDQGASYYTIEPKF